MGSFKATFWDSTNSIIDISANGTSISVTDNSNYQNYTDQATAGGGGYIDLAADASSYTDFYKGYEISLLSGPGAGDKQICTGYNGSTKRATVAAWAGATPTSATVYEIGERGHLKSDFSQFRKLYIYTPTLTYLFSTLGDGDTTTAVPSTATLPITDTYTYTDGDGVYRCILYALPTWRATVPYLYVNRPYVYYSGVMYKLLKNDTGTTPGTDATVWSVVSDITDLAARYTADNYLAVYCDIMECWRDKMTAAYGQLTCNQCNTEILVRNLDIQRAIQMSVGIDQITVLAAKNYWTSADSSANVTDLINFLKNLCCCTAI